MLFIYAVNGANSWWMRFRKYNELVAIATYERVFFIILNLLNQAKWNIIDIHKLQIKYREK